MSPPKATQNNYTHRTLIRLILSLTETVRKQKETAHLVYLTEPMMVYLLPLTPVRPGNPGPPKSAVGAAVAVAVGAVG